MTKRLFQYAVIGLFGFFSMILVGCETSMDEEPLLYTVTFYDGDDQVLTSVEVAPGDAATAPTPPEKLDHTFIGWDTPFDVVNGPLSIKPLYDPLTATGWRFAIKDDSVCLVGYEGDETALTLPNTLAELPVTCIAENAFLNNKNIISVVIPATVTRLEKDAFRDSSVVTVQFEDHSALIELGDGVFRNARALMSVDFGANSQLTTIGADAFRLTSSLTTLHLPDTLTEMGSYVFSHSGLESLTLPLKLERIPDFAFNRTDSLREVLIKTDSHLERIGENAFQYSTLKTLHIPESVTMIEDGAFLRTSQLETVTFADNSRLLMIGKGAFYRSNLQSITLPKDLVAIDNMAFSQTNLESITLPSHVISIGEGAFSNNPSLHTVILNHGLLMIDSYAFAGTPALMSIHIPHSVAAIGYHAFSGNNHRTIYIEATQKPVGWVEAWYNESATIIWGYVPI